MKCTFRLLVMLGAAFCLLLMFARPKHLINLFSVSPSVSLSLKDAGVESHEPMDLLDKQNLIESQQNFQIKRRHFVQNNYDQERVNGYQQISRTNVEDKPVPVRPTFDSIKKVLQHPTEELEFNLKER